MVVESRGGRTPPVVPAQLDLGYLALFLGLRINELVTARLVKKGFGDVRESHGYLIQHLIGKERTITELASRMEVTQQAASKVVAELMRVGAIEVIVAEDRRTKRIRLSSRGWRAVRLARRVRTQVEKRLVRLVGASQYDEAKQVLLQCLDGLGGVERITSRRILKA